MSKPEPKYQVGQRVKWAAFGGEELREVEITEVLHGYRPGFIYRVRYPNTGCTRWYAESNCSYALESEIHADEANAA